MASEIEPQSPVIVSKNVVLHDVSHLLLRREKPYKRRRKPRHRDVENIQHVIVHKSGALGRPGLAGAQGMANFVVGTRKWDDPAYTFWFPHEPEKDIDGSYIVLRCNADNVRSWHTGGDMNTLGVSFGVQGAFSSSDEEDRPSTAQMVCLEAMLGYAEDRYPRFTAEGKTPRGHCLTGHWEHGKPVCPGAYLTRWVRGKRDEGGRMAAFEVPPREHAEVDPLRFGTRSRQLAMRFLSPDPPGPIDGIWGYKSRASLEAFQRMHHLKVDGVWGRHTAARVLALLREFKHSTPDTFADLWDAE